MQPAQDQPERSPCQSGDQSRRIFIRWCVWSVWLFALMRFHPLASQWMLDGKTGVLMTGLECFLLQGIAVFFWLVCVPFIRQQADSGRINLIGRFVSAVPAIFLCVDLWVFHLTGMHLVSRDFGGLLMSLPSEIVGFVSWGVTVSILTLGTAWCFGWIVCSKMEQWVIHRRTNAAVDPTRMLQVIVGGIGIVLALVLTQGDQFSNRYPEFSNTLRQQSSRHPLVAMGWLGPSASNAHSIPTAPSFSIEPDELKRLTDQRISQMRMNVVVPSDPSEASHRPDVLIVIGESLRPELLCDEVMPATFDLTRRGTWLKQHYAGGNSSSLGVFSIVSGLEAIWFYKANVRFAPAMNRLFRQAGYELGFFASTNDWPIFQMDAFLSESKYDVFESKAYEGLQSDRNAIDAAKGFLNNEISRPPRLAVLCLYGTHAPFSSDPAFETDQPAASAGYPIPFPPSWRKSVWNRYRNAARTLDASMASLLEPLPNTPGNETGQRSRITVVTGDHGESFGGDGTIGHGTRLSTDQTRTMAVIAGPGIPHAQREDITHHCDWLPTLLSAAGIETFLPAQFDGIDVTSTDNIPGDRVMSIASYSGTEIVVLGGDQRQAEHAWAELCDFSLMRAMASFKRRIGPDGETWQFHEQSPSLMKRWFETVPFVR